MLLNLNDPDSIVSWWLTFPQRHDAYLDYVARHSPQFGPAIRQARQQLRADPRLRKLLEQATQAAQAAQAEALARQLPETEGDWDDDSQASVSTYLEMAH